MTHFNTAVDFLEYGLLLALAIRIVRNWQVGGRTLGSEPEIGIYACLLILNNVLFLLIDDTRLTFNFIHYCAPIAIWISILKGHVGIFQTSLITVLITILLTALPIYFVVNLFYLLAIIAVMYKAYWLSQRRTNDISKSVLYPFIAFDLISSQLIFSFANTGLDWTQSTNINLYHIGFSLVFLTTPIIIHVKFRRFFFV